MLMGLAIEEDTKKSKRGCEALNPASGNALWHYRLTIAKAKSRPRPRLLANDSGVKSSRIEQQGTRLMGVTVFHRFCILCNAALLRLQSIPSF
jgi:hypothetical protein